MNQTIKQKWITALRSGKFTQITGTMRVSKYECCALGVLCTVAGAKWKKYQNKMTDKTKHYYLVGINGQPTTRAVLDENMVLILGLTPREIGHTTTLIQMNDAGWTFDQIADEIEEAFL